MSFVDRTYPDIVRDVLTNLTQGISQEVHRVTYDPLQRPLAVPDLTLARRPVRRVSLVRGVVATGRDDQPTQPYTFSLNDYELVPSPQDATDLSTLRWLPFGRKPAPDTDVVVNYYPRNVEASVITDVNVGSVARTLVEAIGKELAVLYAQLNLAYDSAFVETATGSSLDRVVALLDYSRYRAGRPVGTVTFRRRAGAQGNITIPAGTPITDAADKIRYETVDTHTLLAGESIGEVRVRGAAATTGVVEPGVLTVIQRAIAGVDSVVNERATTRSSADETDDELRTRARSALIASNKGTVDALTFGLQQLPGVRSVKVEEMPNGVPGEVRLRISLDSPPADGSLPATVRERINALRPAGIRVLGETARTIQLAAQAQLVLAGGFQPPAIVEQIHQGVRTTLAELVGKKGVGERIRIGPLVAALLRDERIVDAQLSIGEQGGAATSGDYAPPPDAIVQLAPADVAFGADAFDQPLSATDQPSVVEVRGTVAATPLTGVPIDTVRAQIVARVTDLFSRLTPGATVDSTVALAALRDDTKYAIDPLRLQLTLTSEAQFIQIVQGGPAFTVQPGQQFTITTIEVTA